jgi:hypothetical protein
MRFYALTDQGQKHARSTRAPKTNSQLIVSFLDKRDQASDEQIAEFTGLDRGTTIATLRHLKSMRPPIVWEVGREEMSEL